MTQENQIQFKPKIEKIIETILHLSHKPIELSRYKIVKLIYLADKEHLNRYGRPITFDSMIAMENGPVPSKTYSILTQDRRLNIDYDALPFSFIKKGQYNYIEKPERDIKRKLFSKSDLKVLDEIAEEYGNQTFGQLYDLTHEHIAYKKAWRARGGKNNKAMRVEDIIEESPNKKSLVEELQYTCSYM